MLEYKGHKFRERLDNSREYRLVTVHGGTLRFPSDYPTIWMLRDIEFYKEHRN